MEAAEPENQDDIREAIERENRDDILPLLMHMYSGSKDDYGKEHVPPLPLSLDRVNEGRSSPSNNLLFKLPLEILGEILQNVDSASLADLALVNRDCRQWARSRQFASIKWDYGKETFEMLSLLVAETFERKANQGATLSPSLGACIRRITVAARPEEVTNCHKVSLDESFARLDEEVRNRRLAAAGQTYFKTYLPIIQEILSTPNVLPHLELLDWEDMICLPRSFFDGLAHSRIRHLKIYRACVGEDFTIGPLDKLATSLSLRTLHLELMTQIHKRDEVNLAPLSASLLRLCAPTLESLTWITIHNKGRHSFAAAGLNSAPSFPCLRSLRLEMVDFLDSSMLDAFLQSKLQTLSIYNSFDSVYSNSFHNCGSIRTLRTFVFETFGEDYLHCLRFLHANTQLSKLSLENPASTVFLKTQLLPLLSRSFSNLTSLRIAWKDNSIPNSALELVSSLMGLQQIHLSAGNDSGWKQDWQIDHKAIQKHLRKLTCLKNMAFSRDSYKTESSRFPVDHYYAEKFFADEYPLNFDERDSIWEQIHRTRMLTEANAYLHLMPQLEWLYFGQIPMGFTPLPGTQGKTAVALNTERDDCWTFLREMFGVKED